LAHYKDRRALALLDGAKRRLGKTSNDEPVWPWLFRFDLPKLAGYRATAEAKLGRWQAAETSLSLAAKSQRSAKQQAVSDIEHARVLAARSQVERACAVAVSAFDAGVTYGSERVVRAVADFRSGLGQVGNALRSRGLTPIRVPEEPEEDAATCRRVTASAVTCPTRAPGRPRAFRTSPSCSPAGMTAPVASARRCWSTSGTRY
jgi:hypothetical protein